MGINTRFETADNATATGVTITWTANEPTASTTQTIADGTVPTVAELGQYVANNEAQIALILADIASLRAAIQAGE
jgi:hypothetical protein